MRWAETPTTSTKSPALTATVAVALSAQAEWMCLETGVPEPAHARALVRFFAGETTKQNTKIKYKTKMLFH
jgi:hypothetical protein